MEQQKNIGELSVTVESGFGRFPLENVFVSVYSEEKEGGQLVFETYTDKSGKTPVIPLEVTGTEDAEFQKYTVEAYKAAYQSAVFHGVPIFKNIRTYQNISLVPLPQKPGEESFPYDDEMISGDSIDFQTKEEEP